MNQRNEEEAARERILTAAEMLFARNGFKGVTVREITAAARVNVAAVNYHFGSKKKLYLDVFRERWVERVNRVRQFFLERLQAADADACLEQVLVRALAEAVLIGPLSADERLRHAQLIIREMTQPSEAFELVVRHAFEPMLHLCAESLAGTRPPDADRLTVLLDSFSLFGMIIYFNFARPVISHVTGRAYDEAFVERLIEHITQFAVHGLAGRRPEEG